MILFWKANCFAEILEIQLLSVGWKGLGQLIIPDAYFKIYIYPCNKSSELSAMWCFAFFLPWRDWRATCPVPSEQKLTYLFQGTENSVLMEILGLVPSGFR